MTTRRNWTCLLYTSDAAELDTAATSIDRLVRDLSDNLFVSEEDKKSVAQYVSIVRKEIAWARVDMRKLRYGDE